MYVPITTYEKTLLVYYSSLHIYTSTRRPNVKRSVGRCFCKVVSEVILCDSFYGLLFGCLCVIGPWNTMKKSSSYLNNKTKWYPLLLCRRAGFSNWIKYFQGGSRLVVMLWMSDNPNSFPIKVHKHFSFLHIFDLITMLVIMDYELLLVLVKFNGKNKEHIASKIPPVFGNTKCAKKFPSYYKIS